MIYLAVLLVLTGLLIVLVALFSESGRARSAATDESMESFSYGSGVSGRIDPEDIDIVIPDMTKKPLQRPDEEDIFISFDDEDDYSGVEKAGGRRDEWELAEPDQDDIIPDSGPLEEIPGSGFSGVRDEHVTSTETRPVTGGDSQVYAVLFDDKSNLIDYNSGGSVIEPSVSSYKNIKRIGRGKVQVDDDGLSFYMDDKFFRFDFHKVYDVWSGPGFIALPLKGGSSVKLFMIEGAPDFPDRVEIYYQEYVKGM